MLGAVQVEEELQAEGHRTKLALQAPVDALLLAGLGFGEAHLAPLCVQLGVVGVRGTLCEAFTAHIALVWLLTCLLVVYFNFENQSVENEQQPKFGQIMV